MATFTLLRPLRLLLIPTGLGLILGPAAVRAADATPHGEVVYQQACKACHGGGFGGFFSGAPKAGSAAFIARLQRAGSVETLVAHTAHGIGKMPAQGGPKGLKDDDLRAAIDWMLRPTP